MTGEVIPMRRETAGLHIAAGLTLPIDAVTQTFLIVGKRGSGKSNTAARFVEQLHHTRLPFVVLDPVDTWWGLKAGRDGGRGLDVYVFGGRKADLPLEPGGGALIAEVLCEHRMSMVLSVKHLSGRERSKFMVAFAQTLFQKWAGGPLHVVLEEAHELAPQMAGSRSQNEDNEAAMLGAFKRLWKLGRASGIGGTAITQRPASLSKDITTQSEILIAHRTIGPQDVKAVGEWVKYHGESQDMLADLPTLPTGQAFVWAPEFPEGQPLGLRRTSVLLRETYDSASTPKVGEQRVEPKELAPVDLERLRVKMAATIEKAKAEDPRELRKQIADLQRQLAAGQKAAPAAAAATTTRDVPVLTDADRDLLAKQRTYLEEMAGKLGVIEEEIIGKAIDRMSAAAAHVVNDAKAEIESRRAAFLNTVEQAKFATVLDKIAAAVPAQPPRHTLTTTARPSAGGDHGPRLSTRVSRPASPGSNGLPPAKQRILDALAFFEGIGVPRADKTQLAFLADQSPTSSAYANNLGAMRSTGLIDYPAGGVVALTDAGRAAADSSNAPATVEELHAAIRSKVPPAKWRLLEVLIKHHPHALSKDRLADEAGASATSSAFANNLGSLRTLGLLDYPTPGHVAATPVLFLEA